MFFNRTVAILGFFLVALPLYSDLFTLIGSVDIKKIQEYILNNKNEIDKVNTAGITPLIYAIRMRDDQIVTLLLENGADPNLAVRNATVTPLSEAALYGNIEAIKLLLAYGANIHWRSSDSNMTPLFYAVAGGNIDAIDVLLKEGSDLNAEDSLGNTILDYAVLNYQGSSEKEKFEKIIAFLVQYIRKVKERSLNIINGIPSVVSAVSQPIVKLSAPVQRVLKKPLMPSGARQSPSKIPKEITTGAPTLLQRKKILQRFFGGITAGILAGGGITALYYYLTKETAPVPTTTRDFVATLVRLFSKNQIEDAYAFADNYQSMLIQLSGEERMALLQAINKARGSLTQAYKAAGEGWPVIQEFEKWRLGSESDQVHALQRLARLVDRTNLI
jgi:Ankyrin repeats (3 copies)/Ankyrin repeat